MSVIFQQTNIEFISENNIKTFQNFTISANNVIMRIKHYFQAYVMYLYAIHVSLIVSGTLNLHHTTNVLLFQIYK